MMHPFRLALVAGLVLVAGCGGLLQSGAPSVQVYVLRPAAVAVTDTAAVDGALAVLGPMVQPGLDSARIALTRPGNRLDYFAGASWGASLSQVVSALATETLQASGRFSLVTEGGVGGSSYQLQLTVRRFEAEYPDDGAAPPRAHVAFECLLTQRVPRKVLGRCDADAVVPASANRLGAIVQALEKAAQQALAQVVDQAAAAAAAPPVPEGAPAGG